MDIRSVLSKTGAGRRGKQALGGIDARGRQPNRFAKKQYKAGRYMIIAWWVKDGKNALPVMLFPAVSQV